jgi:hypothetical protein
LNEKKMSAIPFDTHDFYTELVESGLAEKTATALTKAVAKIEQTKLDDLVTKRDLKEVQLEFKRDIAETKAELIRWVVGVGVLQSALITALLMKLSSNIQ